MEDKNCLRDKYKPGDSKDYPRDQYELRDYLESFNLMKADSINPIQAVEIVENVRKIMSPYSGKPGNEQDLVRFEETRKYYEPDLVMIEKTFMEKDFSAKGLPLALMGLISAIKWK